MCRTGDQATVDVLRDGAPAPAGCSSIDLAVKQQDISWTGTLPRIPRDGEIVSVTTSAKGERRIEIVPPPVRPALAVPLPIDVPLLPLATAHAYGTEGRARVSTIGGRLDISCDAGRRPAGIVIGFDTARLPQGTALRMAVTHRGADFRASLVPMGQDAAEGTLLPDTAAMRTTRFPINAQHVGETPVQLVIQCSTIAARLALDDLRLQPALPPSTAGASAWTWDTQQWRATPATLLERAVASGVRRLHVALETEDGQIRHAAELARFVRLASARGIAVDAVEGDPQMVRPAGRLNAMNRAKAIAAYQRNAAESERLAGIQYDIEPYLLPEFGADRAGVLAAWSGLVRDLAAVHADKLDLVVPFWLLSLPEGEQAMAALAPHLRQLTVMAYRTDPVRIVAFAEPTLAWGQTNGVPVRVALEMGPLDDEFEQRFRPARQGSLALMSVAGQTAALLLKEETTVPAATMLKLAASAPIPAGNLSFLGDRSRLLSVGGELQTTLAAWPSFAGLAFHGLL